MVNEVELRDEGKLIHELLCIWDKLTPCQPFPLDMLFIADINSFILFLSDDPAEVLEKITWLSEIDSGIDSLKKFYREEFKPHIFFSGTKLSFPKVIEYSTQYQKDNHSLFFIAAKLTERLHRFFILLGHWILETGTDVNRAKREAYLKIVLQDLQDFLDE